MATKSDVDPEAPPLWQWINLADYSLPTVSVNVVTENWWATLGKRSRHDEDDSETINRVNGLEVLSDEQLMQIVPDPPDWRGAAAALNGALEDGLMSRKPNQLTAFVVGPPHGGVAGILRQWAEQCQWRILEPPTPEQILATDLTWLSAQKIDDQAWVLPALERVYLRHAAGLDLMRQFLRQACSGGLGRGIIGCDSWAWAFLRRAGPNCRARTLALQAFDQERLSLYLRGLAEGAEKPPLVFRQAPSGKYVLPPSVESPDETAVVDRDFPSRLAVYSRGIPGIARTLWRASLRTRPDAETPAEESASDDSKPSYQTLWITPWNDLKKPTLPAHAGRDHAFVLHTLLLHNGLTAEWLEQLLPLSPDQVIETLWLLQDADLLEQVGEVWQVSPSGYPIVRKFLEGNGYFVDDF